MFARLLSAAVVGIEARLIEVQCDVTGGLPGFHIVGLPEKEVIESRERVRSAIKNSGFSFPPERITANLAPADLKKEGVGFDLPTAVGILAASGQLRTPERKAVLVGELALDGAVQGVRGALPVTLAAREAGIDAVVVPQRNASEAALVEDVDVFAVGSLKEAVAFLRGDRALAPATVDRQAWRTRRPDSLAFDLADVKGQQQARRALEVAAAGGHNLLFVGPPGAGKSLLARCLPTILPPVTDQEALDVTRIYSAAGLLDDAAPLACWRPFRAPHHTISYAGMVGGGHGVPGPGEITLAHHGILFLDELPEFDRRVLDTLRQPLEERSILLSRAGTSIRYPCDFTLVAAMNPCPCGYLGDGRRECQCSAQQIRRYRRRVSGPFLDRMDLAVEVPRLRRSELTGRAAGEPSAVVLVRVERARRIQWQRSAGHSGGVCNARLGNRQLVEQCALDREACRLLELAVDRYVLSARAYDRVLKVARTIADLEACSAVRAQHVAEALQYRVAAER